MRLIEEHLIVARVRKLLNEHLNKTLSILIKVVFISPESVVDAAGYDVNYSEV